MNIILEYIVGNDRGREGGIVNGRREGEQLLAKSEDREGGGYK